MIALAQYVEGVFVMGRAVTKPIRKPAVASRTCAARHPYSYTNRPQMADCGGTLNENSRPVAIFRARPVTGNQDGTLDLLCAWLPPGFDKNTLLAVIRVMLQRLVCNLKH
jgi:hypothetical protein